MREIFFALCKSVDSPVSLGAWLRFEHNQLALAKMEVHPKDYRNVLEFEEDYLVVTLLSKWKGLKTGLDLEQEALSKFASAELKCKETNIRLRKSRSEAIESFTAAVIFTAKRKISGLLGECSLLKIERWWGWGPGASHEIPRRRAFVDTKMLELPIAVTSRAEELLTSVIEHDRNWLSAITKLVTTNVETCKVKAVPKNAKTHRIIAVEPRGNSFLQKGVGGYFRSRLKRVGIDLDDQGLNQDGARRAYTDELATLDLKAASDTVAVELVYELLPLDWANLLYDLTTRKAEMPDGSLVSLEKFSSMGNGFTFELESLIFWAITSSVVSLLDRGGEVLIYGDDIICPRFAAESVISVLQFCGFDVNEEKSFIDGEFFESCGKHYFRGKEVTPIYQKETIESEVELLRLGNRMIRWAHRQRHEDDWLNPVVSSAWQCALRHASWSKHFQLPLGVEGDDGWVVPADWFFARRQDLNLGTSCKVMVFPSRSLPASEGVLYAWALRVVSWRAAKPPSDYLEMPTTRSGASPMSNLETGWQEATTSPDTTSLFPTAGTRWVMPSWEFAITFKR
jgi:hypothetical protein